MEFKQVQIINYFQNEIKKKNSQYLQNKIGVI